MGSNSRSEGITNLPVHGITSSAETTRELGEGLAASGSAVTAVYLPGHGRSAATGSYLITDITDELAQKLGHGFDPQVGHSLGVATGTALRARSPPAECHRAVLVDPALLVTKDQVADIPKDLIADKIRDPGEVLAQNQRWHPRTVQTRIGGTQAADVNAIFSNLERIPSCDVSAEAGQVTVPVLVLLATDVSAVDPKLVTALPSANAPWRFETIPDSSHSLHRDYPELVLQRCLAGVGTYQ